MLTRSTFLTSLTLSALLAIGVGTIAYTNSSAPPTGRTGAPSEQNCTSCHSGTVNAGAGSVVVSSTIPATGYVAGSSYLVTVTVADTLRSEFGFSTTCLNSANNNAGSLTTTGGTGVGIQTAGNGRQYANHSGAGTGTGSKSWTFTWTAPAAGTGSVTFYASGNATNNNNGSSGDNIYTTSTSYTEAATTTSPTAIISTTGSLTGCGAVTVNFSDASTNATSRVWSFPSGSPASSINANQTVTFSTPGTFTVTLIAAGNGAFDTATTTVTVFPTITNLAVAQNGGPGNYVLQVTGGNPPYTFQWKDASGTIVNTTPFFQPSTGGSYTIIATTADGCSDSIQWNNLGAMVSLSATSLTLYPNPGKDEVRLLLNSNAGQIEAISMLDARGKLVLAQSGANFNGTLATSQLSAGIYTIVIRTNKGQVQRRWVKSE